MIRSMRESAWLLLRETIKNWGQSIAGTAIAVLGFVAQAASITMVPQVLWGIAASLFLWATVKTYHVVRVERDNAVSELTDRRNNQGIADMLTTEYEFGVHELKGYAPKVDAVRDSEYEAQFQRWSAAVTKWNEDVRALMERLGCGQREISRFWTISDLRPGMMVRGDWYESFIRLHETRLQRLWELVETYSTRAERQNRYEPPQSGAK
jgi:hypothetical protein